MLHFVLSKKVFEELKNGTKKQMKRCSGVAACISWPQRKIWWLFSRHKGHGISEKWLQIPESSPYWMTTTFLRNVSNSGLHHAPWHHNGGSARLSAFLSSHQ